MTTNSPSRVRLREEILALTAYRQGKPAPTDSFKLSSNENPFPPIPAVLDAIATSSVNRYPDGSALALRIRLADRRGVEVDRIHVGAGSVAILAQLIQASSSVGDEVIYAWRSFEAYPGLVAVAGATSIRVPLTAGAEHDLAAMADAVTERTRLVLVCSPNNPTAAAVTDAAFAAFMARVPTHVLVVLDEAYAEFVTDPAAVDGLRLIDRYPNLVVLRTFSKAYGLAGLRLGYAIGPAYVLDAARTTAIPLSVIEPAQRAGLAALDHEAELLDRVARLSHLRDEVWTALVAQGWSGPAPQGNFVWLPTGASTGAAAETFLRHGVVARALGDDGLRVSIGEGESVEKLLAAAGEVVRNLPVGRVGRG